jgi:hypothetical protein
MELTYVNIPLKYGTTGCLPNVHVATTPVQEASDPIKDDQPHENIVESIPEFSSNDMPFSTEEDFDKIQWPKKEEYQ